MPAEAHRLPSESCTPFSLFEGDLLNRVFSAVGLHGRKVIHLAGRSVVVIAITWLPMALLAIRTGLVSRDIDARNFFADYAAYAQFLIALPLFIVAERVVARNTLEASRHFLDTGVVNARDLPLVDTIHREVERLRRSWAAEIICILIAYALAYFTIAPEFSHADMVTWHTNPGPGWRLTGPGGWALFVALPVLNYWWLRLAWKVIIWTRYLYRMSRMRLVLIASHPDQTGGIGFISEVQARFALVLFAYGISNVAAVIAYKVAIEHAPLSVAPVWGPALGFIIGAPLLFTAPLLMFTKQLYRTKHRALALYREQAVRHALSFESRWLEAGTTSPSGGDVSELVRMNQLATVFDRIEGMRVVPFDWRSAVELIASVVGSVATALPLLKIEGPLKDWLEVLTSMLKH